MEKIKINNLSNLSLDQKSSFENITDEEYHTQQFKCDLCGDKGFIIFEDEEKSQFLRSCICLADKEIKALYKQSGLEKLVNDQNFNTFTKDTDWQITMYKTAIDFADDCRNRWLFVSGQVGAGKTHLCIAVCDKLLSKGFKTKYIVWRETLNDLRHYLINDNDKYQYLIKQIKNISVLFIDDLLKSEKSKSPSSWEVTVLSEIIDYRYRNKELITVISSEWSINQIYELDEAIGSRIFERSKDYLIEISTDKSKNMRFKK